MPIVVLCAVVAAYVVAFSAAPASAAGGGSCSAASARAAIAASKPRLALLGPDKVTITPGQADKVLCFDVTGDGRTAMAVSIFSGGTAGDVGWLLFVPDGVRWRLARSGTGYKLGLFRSGSGLLAVQPVYRKNDPNCCPTGGFDRTLYAWRAGRLVAARSWHTKTFRPPG
jgi:hypothetical protein